MLHISVKVLFDGTSRAVGKLGRDLGPLCANLDKVAQLVFFFFGPSKRLLFNDWVIVCDVIAMGSGGRSRRSSIVWVVVV